MSLGKDDFDIIMMDPEVQKILSDLDVPQDDRHGLFNVLDADRKGMLRIDELVGGIMMLRGTTRKSDVIQVSLMCRSMRRDLDLFRMEVLSMLQCLRSPAGSTDPGLTEAHEGDVSRTSSSAWSS